MNNAEKNIRELRENHLGRRKWSQTVFGNRVAILDNLPNGLRQKQIALFETGYYREKNSRQFQEYLKAFARFLSIHFTNVHYRKKKPLIGEKEFDDLQSEKIRITPQDLEQLKIEELLAKITTITADFTVDGSSFSPNGDKTFAFSLINQSTNHVAQEWLVGDELLSKDVNPLLHLPLGRHQLSLTVSDRHNQKTDTVSKEIELSNDGVFEVGPVAVDARHIAPKVSFETADPENNPARLVHFINNAAPEFYQFEWSFGDGFISHEKCPQHIFQDPGIYQVNLVATSRQESLTVAKPVLIPSADFKWTRAGHWVSRTVNLVNNSRNALYYAWDFGDGEHSDEKSEDHTYDKNGVYTIRLKASSNDAVDEKAIRVDLRNRLVWLILFGAIMFVVLFLFGYWVYENFIRVYPEPRVSIDQIRYQDDKTIELTLTRLTKPDENRIYTIAVQRIDTTNNLYRDVSWPKSEHPIMFENYLIGQRGKWTGTIIESPNPYDPYLMEGYNLSVYCVNREDWALIQEWYSYCMKEQHFPPIEDWFQKHYIKKGINKMLPLRTHNRIHNTITNIPSIKSK